MTLVKRRGRRARNHEARQSSGGLTSLGFGVGVAAAIFAFAEFAHWRASFRRLGSGEEPGDPSVVVVLGFKNRGSRANSVNRERVRAGIRTAEARRGSILVLCGGPVGSAVPEAAIMREYARRSLGFRGRILCDTCSTTTYENIANATPFLEGAASISIVSNPLHAELGRAYLWNQRPDLARRLVRGKDYRPCESPHLRIPAAIVGLLALKRLDPARPRSRATRRSGSG